MKFVILFLTAVALSMDAFAVSICKGLAMKTIKFRHAAIVGAWFGAFQAIMPAIGFLIGVNGRKLLDNIFSDAEKAVGLICGIVAFALLAIIGGNMIREAVSKKEDEKGNDASLSFKNMLLLAIATSIDALAVGVGYGLDDPSMYIMESAVIIGIITFTLSAIGVKVGSIFGNKYEKKAELVGGIILVLLGIKILLEGIGLIDLPF